MSHSEKSAAGAPGAPAASRKGGSFARTPGAGTSSVNRPSRYAIISRICASSYPSASSAGRTDALAILKYPPPASFLNFTSAKSGSIPVVSQSISRPIVPVGAITVVCAFRYPNFSPVATASSQARTACSSSSSAFAIVTPALAPALITSWLIGAGAIFIASYCPESRGVPRAARAWFLITRSMFSRSASNPANAPSCEAISADCRYDRPVRIAEMQPHTARDASES
jgi:hypothetical protein